MHADNCSGQNKNRWVLQYLAWRACCGMDATARISFMIAGHTRSYCDGGFGLVKRNLRSKEVHTPAQMVEVVRTCAASGGIKPVVPSQVAWYDWKAFLELYFDKGCPAILSHQIFSFSAETPGTVLMRTSSASHVSIERELARAFNPPMTTEDWHNSVLQLDEFRQVPSGIPETRMTYLKEKVFPQARGTRQEEFTTPL